MQNSVDQNFINKLVNYLQTKQHKKLQFEVKLLGKIEDQHPIIIFYYAVSLSSYERVTKEDLYYASDLFEQVYLADKSNLLPLQNMVKLSFTIKKFSKVKKYVEEEIGKNNNDETLIGYLAMINHFLGNDDVAIRYFKDLYKKFPKTITGRIPFINSLQYTSNVSQKEYFNECLKYTKLLEENINLEKDYFEFIANKNKKPKIAFISADFRKHVITKFFKHLLTNINKQDFEILLISNVNEKFKDEISEELKKLADGWFDIRNYSDDELTKFLRSLNIDILIDLSGYTLNNRHKVIARRCAKIQIGWLGYHNTICLKNLDYLIADKNLIMKDEEIMYKEKILYLPNIWSVSSVPQNLPDISNKKNNNKIFTFGSFNNFKKISNDTLEVWSKILIDTSSQIILNNSIPGNEETKNNIFNKFLKKGVKENQVIFLDYESKEEDHFNNYNKINLSLDTFPFPGVTTSLESMLMGVPVLTMNGFNFSSRFGVTINKNIDMLDFIATNYDDYIYIAKKLSKDHELHTKNGIKLREKVIKSSLFDTKKFAKDFEKILKEVLN